MRDEERKKKEQKGRGARGGGGVGQGGGEETRRRGVSFSTVSECRKESQLLGESGIARLQHCVYVVKDQPAPRLIHKTWTLFT